MVFKNICILCAFDEGSLDIGGVNPLSKGNNTQKKGMNVPTFKCQHLIPGLNAWAARAKYTTACPISSKVSWAGMTSNLNVALIRKLRGSSMCLAYIFDVFHRFYTTRHCQTSG